MKLSSYDDEVDFLSVTTSPEQVVKTLALVVVVPALAGAQSLLSCVVI